jgi:hypothetical protein
MWLHNFIPFYCNNPVAVILYRIKLKLKLKLKLWKWRPHRNRRCILMSKGIFVSQVFLVIYILSEVVLKWY